MAETPSFKIQYEYQNPNNVESEVPGSQNIREVTEQSHVENADGVEEIQNGGYTITRSSYTEQSETVEGTKVTRTTVTLSTNSTSEELVSEDKTEVVSEKTQVENGRPKTRIPKLKFRQAAERVKRERRLTRGVHETHIPVPTTPTKLSRHSKIPAPTSKPMVLKRDSENVEVTRPDEEFDKIYEEIVENTQTEIEVKHPELIESKFEEIIHDYDENNVQPINVEKIRKSRIPSLRRRGSEHTESKTVEIAERPKSRSLPRLKEISMRVKADNEGLGHVMLSRSVSTEQTSECGQKNTIDTKTIKTPEIETKISKVVKTETIMSGKELNKNIEGNSKSVTVHRTVRITSQSEALVDIDKNIDQSNTLQTENIMKGCIRIGYPTFEAKVTENTTEIFENDENINNESKNITSEVNETVVDHTKSHVSEATSTIKSNIATKASVTKLASSYEVVTGSNEIISSKIFSGDNEKSVETTELNPTSERTMTITRRTLSSSDRAQIKEIDSPISPAPENNNISRATERRSIEIKSKIPIIEHSSTITRVESSSNDVRVKEVKDFETSATENQSTIKITDKKLVNIDNNTQAVTNNENHTVEEIKDAKSPRENETVKKVTMVRKIVDVQNNNPTVEQSVTVTRIVESNGMKTKEIEDNKSPKDGKDNYIEKAIAKKTIITAINKQMGETTKNDGETIGSNKNISTKSYEVEKETNAEELTTVTGNVGKCIHRIASNEVTTETITKKDQTDELPKKKSILSKIAMFERYDIEDRMPRKKSENLSKLVIKNSPQKVAHLHTPTIVEEVLKSHENSPLTATSSKNYSRLDAESVTTPDYTEIKQVGEYRKDVNLINSHQDHRFVKSESIREFDYKVNADEYKQIVEMTKITSNSINKDYKDNVFKSDYKSHEVNLLANNFKQNVEIRKEMSNPIASNDYDVGSIKSELLSTVEHKFDADIKDLNIQYEKGIKTNENSFTISDNKDDNAVTLEPPRTFGYQFKGVNKLTSEYERKAEISNNRTLITKDAKIDYSLKPEPVKTIDYNIENDMNKSTYEIGQKDETSKHITNVTNRTNDNTSVKSEPVTKFDYTFKVDNRKQEIDYNQIADATEEKSTLVTEENKGNPVTSEASTIEYTFKDVKKLATEYEQKVENTKNLEVSSRMATLSPSLLNYDSKYISKSCESLGKVMTDAPVILVTPKLDFQSNTSINKWDDENEISTRRIKETASQQATETSEIQLRKQFSTEVNETKRYDNILVTSSTNSKAFERSTSLKFMETSNFSNSKTSNESKSIFIQSPTNVTTVNWVPKGTIVDNKLPSDIQTSKVLETTKGDDTEVKSMKLKGYVIKREGDLAYARIQEEAEHGDEIRTFSEVSKLPRIPVKETTSTVTRRYKSVEEKKKYYADVDINTVIKGKVSRMISRMTSVEIQEADKKIIDIKEMPRKMSVLEKIAMFESKASAGQTEYSYIGRTRVEKAKPHIHNMTQEEFEERVAELKSARLLYGSVENMPSIMLRNGVEMPVLALGTATLDTRLIPYIIGAAIELGYRAIDAAYVYGNEKEIGEAIRAKIEDGTVRRDELFIISKLWSTFHRTDLVEKACRSSLEAMGLEYFDLYMIHNPMSFKEGGDAIPKIATVIQYSQFDYLDAWYGMEQLMTKGLVRSIGVSNFNSVQLQRILDKGKIKPTVNQVECHPYLSQQKLDSFCEERDIKLSCYGVLGSKGTPAEYKGTLPPVIDDPLVQVMASGLNVSPAQLLIKYQLDSGRTAVVKASSGKHLWDNLQAMTVNLTQGQIEALQALNRNKRNFAFKGMGDTHKNYPFKIPF